MPTAFTGYSFHVLEAIIVFFNEILVCFFLPTKRLLGTTRRMLQCTLGRVLCAGFFPVIFRDVMTGDILTSMVKPMNDLGHLSC